MKTPEFLAPYLTGEVLKVALGTAILVMIVGFNWADWHLKSTVDKLVSEARQQAQIAALAPICVARFQQAAQKDSGIITALHKGESWERGDNLMKAGWATFAGEKEPNPNVASECVTLLMERFPLPPKSPAK